MQDLLMGDFMDFKLILGLHHAKITPIFTIKKR